ncbi:MAG: LSM domain-containing protein [Candidatus Thermoplasmatota archaeon]|nr:LSM domain-containing protein [Candidatus Thermoplasmatota archaeon]MDI6887194.1 LSM domain-containing protein [Candidatus Thermoplasmatota archaeon]
MVLPMSVLEKALDTRISLLLKDNRILEGKLVGYDEYMNLVLEDVEEQTAERTRRLGTTILRGNNVVSIAQK